MSNSNQTTTNPEKKKRFIGKSGATANKIKPKTKNSNNQIRTNEIPSEIKENKLLNQLIKECLPSTYNFELHKTIHQVIQNKVKILGLQMPEGLLQFSLIISDLIRKFCPDCQDVIVLGDVTYGACCVDDLTAKALGCQMLIHYGHSCLIPVDQTSIKTLYVFVEIGIDRIHLAQTIRTNFPGCMQEEETRVQGGMKHLSIEHEHEQQQQHQQSIHLALVGTVQFVSAVQELKLELEQTHQHINTKQISNQPSLDDDQQLQSTIPSTHHFQVTVPQVKPLSPGEILGCTAPRLSPDIDAILYLGDGRFHLESIMIANPSIPAFRYDPYEKKITREGYDHIRMRRVRASAIDLAEKTLTSSDEITSQQIGSEDDRAWAVVLGTLGRQGSLSVLKSITTGLKARARSNKLAVPILISEISAAKLGLMTAHIDVCVQTSCPRLSIDWGHDFLCHYQDHSSSDPRVVPLLNPYEAKVALGQAPGFLLDSSSTPTTNPSGDQKKLLDSYPMDFYADQSLGDWTPRHGRNIRPVPRSSIPPTFQ